LVNEKNEFVSCAFSIECSSFTGVCSGDCAGASTDIQNSADFSEFQAEFGKRSAASMVIPFVKIAGKVLMDAGSANSFGPHSSPRGVVSESV
jgi:hypothetical protein